MEWLDTYESELHVVFNEGKRILADFPPPLNRYGMSYLERFDVFATGSRKNYICYLLPFWLRDEFSLDPETARRMALGNVLCMLYFFLQDDAMDSGTVAVWQLPLANLLYAEFLNLYRPLFPAHSPFWAYCNRYLREWADSVTNEAEGDYFFKDRRRIAHKASPLKLSGAAAMLLSGNNGLIEPLGQALDETLIALQMLDDYEDWEADWHEGGYNCLLSLAAHSGQRSGSLLTQEYIRSYIYTFGGLSVYADIAVARYREQQETGQQFGRLSAFHRELVGNLRGIADAVEAEKNLLSRGGLEYYLAKFQ
ncbi:hypothetical protein [Paenibacillus sp. NFR01]|uniref:hypothetical protein n=1 Tax=Paenibacillus sp. NFR01 TaxID=1566279 RepID=UPI0008B9FA70|nr:hypothetical protein [Paenibacillus sp. NFR01]SEU00570.1 hypothetical protein SAMN03159358_3060 [Paenibacillus sp. NFR01]